jgi:putative transposase
MTAVAIFWVSPRSNTAEFVKQRPSRARRWRPLADQELVGEIKTIIDDMPTYGYRRSPPFSR